MSIIDWFDREWERQMLRKILVREEILLELLRMPRMGLSHEDRARLERSVKKLERLAAAR